MRRVPMLLALTLLSAACARPVDDAAPVPAGGSAGAFTDRATKVADGWLAAPGRDSWRTGFVPLEDLTVVAADPGFDEDTKAAFVNGWFRAAADLPRKPPAAGTIRYPDGTERVPLVSAADAYAALDQGDPPPCPRGGRGAPPPPPPAADASPDSTASHQVVGPCIPLTVTRATLGTVSVRTSRGAADTPAWIFTVEELPRPVIRVAVAPSAVRAAPSTAPVEPSGAPGVAGAEQLTGIDGTSLRYQLGVGACDTAITPLVHETDEVVVLGGSVTTSSGVCTDQLLLKPVSVTLRTPLGARPVLDVRTGQAMVLRRG